MKSLTIAVMLAAVGAAGAHAQLAKALDLNDRGNRAAEEGKMDEAIGLYRESLDIWRASGPEYDAHRAGSLFNLSIVMSAAGNRVDAVRVMEESLALHRKTLGPTHHRTISNMNLLASNYLVIGRVDESEAMFREVMPVARELYPKDIQMARALEGLCSVLIRRGKPQEGIALAEEALAIAVPAAGADSLDAGLAYANVAEALRASGQPERSLPLFRKSRALYEKTLGPDHPRVAALLSQEGMLFLEDGKTAMAERLMTRAIEALDRSCPKCNLERANAENNLAVLRLRQKKYREAGELLTHVVALRENNSKPGQELAETLKLLAAVRQKEKRFDDAERLVRRADVILGYR